MTTATRSTQGVVLVASSAILWSFGGAIERFIGVDDRATIIFWRSLFAAVFLLIFLVWRDGLRQALQRITGMGLPGLLVTLCFAMASSAFVVALAYTTVANILLVQAGVPLIAALLGWLMFSERVSAATWIAIACVIIGIAIMVSESFTGEVSPVGDMFALLIAVAFAIATVTTRHAPGIGMTPAVLAGTVISCIGASFFVPKFAVSAPDFGWLFLFGAINLGLGLAVFSIGARMIPAAFAALVGTLEPILGPIWVWLIHSEVASVRTLIGGGIVFVSLFVYTLLDWLGTRQPTDELADFDNDLGETGMGYSTR
jgi:drug/metabolite transporter (DMT)-like permease